MALDTIVNAFYEEPFPTYEQLSNWIRASRISVMAADFGPTNHQLLKRIFDSKMDENVVRKVGAAINERGGVTVMGANFYIYCHFVGERLKDMNVTADQWRKMHYDHARCIESFWHGIGDWQVWKQK